MWAHRPGPSRGLGGATSLVTVHISARCLKTEKIIERRDLTMPKRIAIPFSMRFEEPMLDGTKTQTARYKVYGQVGDWFEAFGAEFILESISSAYLHRVATLTFMKEGFVCVADFIRFWEAVHPRRGYQPNSKVYVHKFFRSK